MPSLEQMAVRWALSSRQSIRGSANQAGRVVIRTPARSTSSLLLDGEGSRFLACSCAPLPSRRPFSSTSRVSDEGEKPDGSSSQQTEPEHANSNAQSTTAQKADEAPSLHDTSSVSKPMSSLDQLFTSKEDFKREDFGETRPQREPIFKQTVSRSVLGGVLDDSSLQASRNAIGYESDELNREWGAESEEDGQRVAPLNYRKHAARPRPNRAGTQMTIAEQRAFREIFQRVSPSAEKPAREVQDQSTLLQDGEDERPFASLSSGSPLGFSSFFQRNVSERERRQLQQKSKLRRSLALLGEGPASSRNVSTEELTAGIDRIREEVSACQSVHEVWEWARENVWPAAPQASKTAGQTTTNSKIENRTAGLDLEPKEAASEGANSTSVAADEVSAQSTVDSASTASLSGPAAPAAKYGVTSPFYAAVLLTLHTQLRERFHAPHSALAVLWFARRLGPESLVLGCTPALYEAALRTCWTVLHDLEGTYKLVVEARASGILTGEYNAEAEQASRLARRLDVQADDDGGAGRAEAELASEEKIAGLIDSVRADVMREIAHTDRLAQTTGQRSSRDQGVGSSSIPAIHERRLFILNELARLAPVPDQRVKQRREWEARRLHSPLPNTPRQHYRPPNTARPRRFGAGGKDRKQSSTPDAYEQRPFFRSNERLQ